MQEPAVASTPAAPADEDERPPDLASAEEFAYSDAQPTDEVDLEELAPMKGTPKNKLRIEKVDTADLGAALEKLAPSTKQLLAEKFRAEYLGLRDAKADEIF